MTTKRRPNWTSCGASYSVEYQEQCSFLAEKHTHTMEVDARQGFGNRDFIESMDGRMANRFAKNEHASGRFAGQIVPGCT